VETGLRLDGWDTVVAGTGRDAIAEVRLGCRAKTR